MQLETKGNLEEQRKRANRKNLNIYKNKNKQRKKLKNSRTG